jgi:cell shape-determining protein MreC
MMTKSPRFFLGVFFIIILVLTAFFYRNEILYFLGVVRSLDYEELEALRLENLSLKEEIELLRERDEESPEDLYVTARVYSRYPFNDRRLVTIALGEKDGISEGMPVLVMRGVLLGKVKKVFGRQAEVETIFDPAWRSSVVISSEGEPSALGTRALLEGGTTPILTLISRDSAVSVGAPVFNTSPEFPLKLLLGEISQVRPASDDIWLTAELNTLYNPENLSEVLVVINFP